MKLGLVGEVLGKEKEKGIKEKPESVSHFRKVLKQIKRYLKISRGF